MRLWLSYTAAVKFWDGPLFPQVEEGYWFFCDDQTGSYTAQGVMERPSQNFTAAVYDSQSRTLYCGELDT